MLVAAEAGDGDELELLAAGQRARAARELIAVHARQPDVDECDIGPEARDFLQCCRGVVAERDLVALSLEQQLQAFARVGLVLDHQHPMLGCDLRPAALGAGCGLCERQADREGAALAQPVARGGDAAAVE